MSGHFFLVRDHDTQLTKGLRRGDGRDQTRSFTSGVVEIVEEGVTDKDQLEPFTDLFLSPGEGVRQGRGLDVDSHKFGRFDL